MIEVLRNHIISKLGNELDRLDEVLAVFEPIKVKRNVSLVEQGEICNFVYFVAKGCLQVYVYDKDFNENTRDIVVEDNWCSELLSFGSGKPATENIRTVEPSEIFAIDRRNFQHMMKTVPQFDKVYQQILETAYANSVYRLNTFVALTAIERMQWLMEYRPTLMSRVSSKLIASYLGINKYVYSRLKAKL